MKRMKQMVTAAAVAMMLATAGLPGATAEAAEAAVPAQAVNDNVAVVVWFDLESIDQAALRGSMQALVNALPDEMAQHREGAMASTDESLTEFTKLRDAFLGAGGQGVLMVVPGPADAAEDAWGQQPARDGVHIQPAMQAAAGPEPMVLARVAPGTQPEDLVNAFTGLEGVEGEPEFEAYAEGWLRVTGEPGMSVIEDGTEQNAAVFRQLLDQAGDAPIRVAVRITDDMKQEMAAQGQGNPMMGGFQNSLDSLSTAWAAVHFGEQPEVRNQFNFDDAEAAAEFNAAWEGLLMMGEGMIMGQLAQMPEAPGAETVQGLFQSLKMEQQGASLSLTLDDAFIEPAGEFVPVAMGMAMQMMMGGMQMEQGGGNQGGEDAPPMF
ncbi:MAG: hypothetical protein WDZ31_01605 [Phycisphaeraceae bacterium]